MDATKVQYNPTQVIQFNRSYFNKAIQRSNVSTRQEAQAQRKQDLNPTPEQLGKYAGNLRIESQFSKTPQERFMDLFA